LSRFGEFSDRRIRGPVAHLDSFVAVLRCAVVPSDSVCGCLDGYRHVGREAGDVRKGCAKRGLRKEQMRVPDVAVREGLAVKLQFGEQSGEGYQTGLVVLGAPLGTVDLDGGCQRSAGGLRGRIESGGSTDRSGAEADRSLNDELCNFGRHDHLVFPRSPQVLTELTLRAGRDADG